MLLYPKFVERKVRYSALFTNLVGRHAGNVSFPLSDVILAQLACPLSNIKFCLHSGITNLSLYKHWLYPFENFGWQVKWKRPDSTELKSECSDANIDFQLRSFLLISQIVPKNLVYNFFFDFSCATLSGIRLKWIKWKRADLRLLIFEYSAANNDFLLRSWNNKQHNELKMTPQ